MTNLPTAILPEGVLKVLINSNSLSAVSPFSWWLWWVYVKFFADTKNLPTYEVTRSLDRGISIPDRLACARLFLMQIYRIFWVPTNCASVHCHLGYLKQVKCLRHHNDVYCQSLDWKWRGSACSGLLSSQEITAWQCNDHQLLRVSNLPGKGDWKCGSFSIPGVPGHIHHSAYIPVLF